VIDRQHQRSFADDRCPAIVPNFDNGPQVARPGDALFEILGECQSVRFASQIAHDGDENIKHPINLVVSDRTLFSALKSISRL